MKVTLVNPATFTDHPHPASKLFRSIELKTIFEQTKSTQLRHPSLDLGCGDGYLCSILFDDKLTYGLDNGEAQDYHIAIEKHRYDQVLVEGAEKMSLPDNTLNFVFSNSVIEHIPPIDDVLREVSRTLKKGGDFIFTAPSHRFREYLYVQHLFNALGLRFLGDWYSQKRNKMLNHYNLHSHEEWTTMLAKHNLKVINYKYYISKEVLQFWDKIALQVRLLALFRQDAEEIIYKKYKETIEEYYRQDKVTDDTGASLYIHAIKI